MLHSDCPAPCRHGCPLYTISILCLASTKAQEHAFVLTEYKKDRVLCQVRKDEVIDAKPTRKTTHPIIRIVPLYPLYPDRLGRSTFRSTVGLKKKLLR